MCVLCDTMSVRVINSADIISMWSQCDQPIALTSMSYRASGEAQYPYIKWLDCL